MKRIILPLLLILIVSSCKNKYKGYYYEEQTKSRELDNRNGDLQAKIIKLEEENETLKEENETLKDYINEQSQNLNSIKQSLEDIENNTNMGKYDDNPVSLKNDINSIIFYYIRQLIFHYYNVVL